MRHPSGRPGFRPHIRLLKVSPRPVGLHATTPLLPDRGALGLPDRAGLTSKPHRDRTTKSRLTWTALPAAGIGLPPRCSGDRSPSWDATTDPDGCHKDTLALTRRPCAVRGNLAALCQPNASGAGRCAVRPGRRRWVAATTAAPSGVNPATRSARHPSARVAPVVTRSSMTTIPGRPTRSLVAQRVS